VFAIISVSGLFITFAFISIWWMNGFEMIVDELLDINDITENSFTVVLSRKEIFGLLFRTELG